MKEPDRSTSSSGAPGVVLLVVGLTLPALYVLGLGPAIWLADHGYANAWFLVIYSPLEWLYESCPPLQPAIDWYIDFWR